MDNVVELESAAGGRRPVKDARDHYAAANSDAKLSGELFVDVADLHAEVAALDAPILEQLLHDFASEFAADRQRDPLRALAVALDGGVDADHLAIETDERSAAVAGIDRRVGLQKVLVLIQSDVV